MSTQRLERYADAIAKGGHAVCCPEQVENVIAVADAELAALWTDLERHEIEVERLARVRALVAEWQEIGQEISLEVPAIARIYRANAAELLNALEGA